MIMTFEFWNAPEIARSHSLPQSLIYILQKISNNLHRCILSALKSFQKDEAEVGSYSSSFQTYESIIDFLEDITLSMISSTSNGRYDTSNDIINFINNATLSVIILILSFLIHKIKLSDRLHVIIGNTLIYSIN